MGYESKFADVLFRNVIIFLDESVGFINKGFTERRNMILAIIHLQIAMELALKYSVVNYFGIRTALIDKQAQMSDEDLEELFYKNKLRLKEYDALKNFTKSRDADIGVYDFDKEQYQYMERFQNYRNQILHSSYIFTESEYEEMEKDVISVLIHVIGVLMSDRNDEEYRKFIQEYLNDREYSELIKNPIYNRELRIFLENEYEGLLTCPYCGTRTLTPYKYCARCLTDFDLGEDIFAFVKCGWCGEKAVICDAANIEINNYMIRGLCLNCGEDTTVYKCPKCHNFVNAEVFDFTNCHEGFCKNERKMRGRR